MCVCGACIPSLLSQSRTPRVEGSGMAAGDTQGRTGERVGEAATRRTSAAFLYKRMVLPSHNSVLVLSSPLQLFCMVCALLRDTNMVVMDEATASIDMATETQMQRVMAEAFRNKTVLTIAVSACVWVHVRVCVHVCACVCVGSELRGLRSG